MHTHAHIHTQTHEHTQKCTHTNTNIQEPKSPQAGRLTQETLLCLIKLHSNAGIGHTAGVRPDAHISETQQTAYWAGRGGGCVLVFGFLTKSLRTCIGHSSRFIKAAGKVGNPVCQVMATTVSQVGHTDLQSHPLQGLLCRANRLPAVPAVPRTSSPLPLH